MQITQSSTSNKWPGANKPDEIVIHHFDDPAKHPTLSGVVAHFQDPASQVSAHYVVSDQTVIQMMPETDAAWHAVTANRHSVGIEIDPNIPGDTYKTVGELVRQIRGRWGNIPLIRHRDVPGTSTTCPGDTNLDLIEQYARGEDMADFDTVVYIYWLALHRNYNAGEVTKQEVEGQVGRRVVDILNDMKGSKEWLTENDFVKFGQTRLDEITKLNAEITQLQAAPTQAEIAALKQKAADLQVAIDALVR